MVQYESHDRAAPAAQELPRQKACYSVLSVIWVKNELCIPLESESILGDLCHELSESVKIDFGSQNTDTKVRLLMDCSYLVNQSQSYRKRKQKLDELSKLEYQCRRLTFALHNMRFQELSKLNTRRR